ncbi:MAG: M14 family metallopeptidase [Pyrinomonadaceae bacterium]
MRIILSPRLSASLRLCGLILVTAITVAAQTVPAPKDVLGWTPGDDRTLASWAQVVDYFQKLDKASDRVMFQEIGKTTMGAPFVYATISSPENLRQIKKYELINAKLADPRKIKSNDAAAKALIKQGKTIVLITCGVHSTEVGSYLSSMLIAQRLAGANDAETKKILDNTIILLVPALNPDGVDIVKNWYDKTLGTKFEGTEPPELYHKYVGHDDNRDWYAFTQVETQLTVDKIHNVWHPQIVHDIHQQGANGSRLFLPPYMQPVEPNVPKQIVEGYTELGNAMAADLRKQGFQGITTNSTYDAWTPARAYSHYHGGVRILSETASCKLATPITVKWEDIRGGEGYDARKESANFGPVWHGGEWHIRDITNYMTTAAFSLLNNAANDREKWLSRFYEIGKEAVRPRAKGEIDGYLLEDKEHDISGSLKSILERGGVKSIYTTKGYFIPLSQPYGLFAKSLLEKQEYPNLKDRDGNPIPPYDVTAHTLTLLMDVEAKPVQAPYVYKKSGNFAGAYGCGVDGTQVYIYKSFVPAIDEGWTRWVFDQRQYCSKFQTIVNAKLSSIKLLDGTQTIIFPDQSPNQILNGYAKGAMPDEYTGGVGKEGVENLKKFVQAGGTLVFLNRSSDFAIEQFNLPIKDVTKGLARKDFYIPGSILRTELDLTNPIAKGMPRESIAWFEGGPAFEIVQSAGLSPSERDESRTLTAAIIARYPSDPSKILLSGWALGAEKIAGKAALVEVKMGKGKIILFGFRPQYRGQSLATFPLLFNAISQ